jgi:very-short-patch-repair endonuclease
MNEKTNNYGDKILARELRRETTLPENILWQHLRRNTLGVRFRRQHPVGPYVLDFFCYKLNLCIELDGEVHQAPQANEKDYIRTDFLNRQGITVLRFSNDVVLKNTKAIIQTISNYAERPKYMPGWHMNEIIDKG